MDYQSVILNQGPQFVAELMKELNSMLEIETRLLMAFYPQTDRTDEPRIGIVLEIIYRVYITK